MTTATMPQHMIALEKANAIRLARADLKRKVKVGRKCPAEIIRACPWEAETMTVGELLRSQNRWGRTRARKFLLPLAISENRAVGRLTQRQRDELAVALELRRRGLA